MRYSQKIAGSPRSIAQTIAKVYTKSSTLDHNLSPEREVNTVSKKNEGIIISYARGPKTQKPKECILSFPNIESSSEATHIIGRKVAWPIRKHKTRGKIIAFHGKNGLVRARFKKGVPGQALGSPVEIVG
jgi:large subunit ribosomal protein L35Ae